ncbi:MAG: metal ABC transporter permease [Acidimicrobiales bacterium]
MFSGFMLHTWEVATILGVVAGMVGFFVVLRGAAFAAHVIPNGAFAGAAGAALVGVNAIVGLGVFALLGALGIGALGRRGRRDVAAALAVVAMLGLGALFASMTTEYAPEIYSLLFGEVLGVASSELLPTALIAAVCAAAVLALYRPLTLSGITPEVASARGIRCQGMEVCLLLVIALTTAAAVPVVGTLLTFSLLISPPAAARSFTSRPGLAMAWSVAIALATVWASIAISFVSNLPVGFFIGSFGGLAYAVGRTWDAHRHHRGGVRNPASSS